MNRRSLPGWMRLVPMTDSQIRWTLGAAFVTAIAGGLIAWGIGLSPSWPVPVVAFYLTATLGVVRFVRANRATERAINRAIRRIGER